jgi:hypothetical protein
MYCCICVDADWAHPRVTQYVLEYFERSRIKFTFFATDNQVAPNSSLCELAWHPNFERGTCAAELDQLVALFPGVKGLRPHRLNWGDCDDQSLSPYKIKWVSSVYMKDLWRPVFRSHIVEIPISWGDNWWFLKRLAPAWQAIQSDASGIYVINFHPIHVLLNTETLEQYEAAKTYYQDPDVLLEKFRSPNANGVERMFKTVLKEARRVDDRFLCISEALERYQSER